MSERGLVTAIDVARWLRGLLEKGEFGMGDRLPSERGISEKLGTSRVTAREALRLLESEGAVYRANRRGWFVTPPRINYDPSRPMFFMDYVADQGFKPFSKQISKKKVVANESLAQLLEIETGSKLVELIRVRGTGTRPVYVETILLPEQRLPGIFDCDLEHSVTSVLRDFYNAPCKHVDINMIASSLNHIDAELLQAPVGYNSLEIKRISRDKEGHFLEYDQERWRHDALNLKVRLDIS